MNELNMIFSTAIISALFTLLFSAFVPSSTIQPLFWEFIFRSPVNDSMISSKSPLLASIRNRYEQYVSPLFSSHNKSLEPTKPRTQEYISTTKLLEEIIESNSSYVKTFVNEESVYIFVLRRFNLLNNNESIQEERLPIIGKITLLSIPLTTLLHNEERENKEIEEIEGLNICWTSYIPGLPSIVSFSDDNKHMAIGYQQLIEGGVRHRIRYYPIIQCITEFAEKFNAEVYEDYVNSSMKFEDKLTKWYNDLYIDARSNIISLAVAKNKIAYSLYYDTKKFHVLEKTPFSDIWIERQNGYEVERSKNLYGFCYELYMIEKNNKTLIITLTRKGDWFEYLDQDIDIYEFINIQDEFSTYFPIIQTYNSKAGVELSLPVTLPRLYSSNRNSQFIVDKNKNLIVIFLNKDKGIVIPLPFDDKGSEFDIHLLPQEKSMQGLTGTKSTSILVTYSKNEHGFIFYLDYFSNKYKYNQ